MEIGRLYPHLKSLGLSYMPLEDDTLGYIAKLCPCIVHLDIEGGSMYSDEGILAVVKHLPRLQSLNIRYNDRLTDSTIVHLYTHLTSTLHTLHICRRVGCPRSYSYSAIEQLLLRCTQLRNFSYQEWISTEDRNIFNYSALCKLTTLCIEYSRLTEPQLAAIALHAFNLQRLSTHLSEVSTVTGNGSVLEPRVLEHFVTGFPKLRELYFWPYDACDTLLEPLKAGRPDVMVYADFVPTKLRYDLLSMEI